MYCKEEHVRTIKKISSLEESAGNKVITEQAFVAWYVPWLFGESERDDESTSESAGDTVTSDKDADEAADKSEGWGSMFKMSKEGSKCAVCMVSNILTATACAT